MASCQACEKKESETTWLQRCAICWTTSYCSRECQSADWKSHEKVCSQQAAAMFGGGGWAPPTPPWSGPSPLQGLEQPILYPFTRLENGTYLHDRPEKDVYRILLEAYRLRADDDEIFGIGSEESTIYKDTCCDGRGGFTAFIRKAACRPGLLPAWWTPENQEGVMNFGLDFNQWQNLYCAVNSSDIIEYYRDSRYPIQLRMLAEVVYSYPVGGKGAQSTARVREMMASMEAAGLPEGAEP